MIMMIAMAIQVAAVVIMIRYLIRIQVHQSWKANETFVFDTLLIVAVLPVLFFSAPLSAVADDAVPTMKVDRADGYDWVRLTSGEWLKGKVEAMYDDKLEFDSENLKLLTIDMEDVSFLEVRRPMGVNIDGQGVFTGRIELTTMQVFVYTGDEKRTFDRKDLISFSPTADKEINLWTTKLGLGLNVRQGNTNQLDYTAKLSTQRRTAKSRYTLEYMGNISRSGTISTSTETANNHRVTAEADVFLSRRFFYRILSGEYYRDPFTNIDQRISVYTGAGHVLVDTRRLQWDIIAGPSLLTTRFVSVQAGQPIRQNALGFVAKTNLDAELTSWLDFIFQYDVQLMKPSAGGYIHHMETTLDSEITRRLDLELTVIWDKVSHPTVNAQGILPKSDDMRLVVGISFEL